MRGEFVDVGGARLYCYALGVRSDAVPVVFVHGAFQTGHDWGDVAARLPKGHRILVLDLLAHGRSDRAVGYGLTPADHAARLAALLETLGVGPACVVGHGLGAAVALALAHRQRDAVSHLALVAPWLVHDAATCPAPPRPLRSVAALGPLWRALPPDWLASALHRTMLRGAMDPLRGAHVLDRALMPYRSEAGRAMALAQLAALADPASIVPLLREGGDPLPTLLLIGANDPFLPRAAQSLADEVVTARAHETIVHRLAGLSYALPCDAPDRVAATLAELLAR